MPPADPNRSITASEFYDTLRMVFKVFTQGMMDDDIDRAIEEAKRNTDAHREIFDLLLERMRRREQA